MTGMERVANGACKAGAMTLLILGAFGCARLERPATDEPAPAVVARVGEREITAADLEEAMRGQLLKMEVDHVRSVFSAKQRSLDFLIDSQLIRDEAARRNVTPQELMTSEIRDKAEVTEDEIRAFYEKVKDRMQGSYEEGHDQIEQYLRGQKQEELKKELLTRLREEAQVEVTLPYPALPSVKIAEGQNEPSVGPAQAPVTIVEFSDFQCPYCARMAKPVRDLVDAYPGQVRLVYRYFPLSFHEQAWPASEAAACADEQGHFWDFHDLLFENQKDLSEEKLTELAQSLNLDLGAFGSCVQERRYEQVVAADVEAGRQAGVQGTPAFFVNGRPIFGAESLDVFRELIDRELGRQSS